MPANVKVFQPRDFIRASADGTANLGKSRELLAQIVSASADLDQFHILLDARKLRGAHTPDELWSLAQEVLKHPRTFQNRTAILVPFEKFDRASYFALITEQKGLHIQVFTSYEEAMEWLIGS